MLAAKFGSDRGQRLGLRDLRDFGRGAARARVEAMLRITIYDSAREFRLRLEGRLAGPWVREVEMCWQTALSVVGGRAVVVDLRDVDFVDDAGERLLAAMHQRGTQFLAARPMTAHLIREITGAPEGIGEPAATHSRKA